MKVPLEALYRHFLGTPFHSLFQELFLEKGNKSLLKTKSRAAITTSFGSSAIFSLKIRRFPSPPHERFGFVGIKFSTIEFSFFW